MFETVGSGNRVSGLVAHTSGLKLATSTHVLSILDIVSFQPHPTFSFTYLLWEPEPVC